MLLFQAKLQYMYVHVCTVIIHRFRFMFKILRITTFEWSNCILYTYTLYVLQEV